MSFALGFFSTLSHADELTFKTWVQKISLKFHKKGISKSLLRNVFHKIELDNEVLILDRNQPEFKQSFGDYLIKRLTPSRVKMAKKLYVEHKELLTSLHKKYGVSGEVIVALWSLETNHGTYMGSRSIIRSLVTLSYDGRRKDFFENELYHALVILQQGHTSSDQFNGSWAGAMGQMQFMPSTFINYAVDGDDDRIIDVWGNLSDAFSSAAHYLQKMSWHENDLWGQEVTVSSGLDWSRTGLEWSLPVTEWIKYGVQTVNGITPSNRFQRKASLITPAGSDGPRFLTYNNFRAIMRWNNSVNYALSVGILSDLILERYYLTDLPLSVWRKNYPSLSTIKSMQIALREAGYEIGEIDGIIGRKTRSAIVSYQLSNKLITDGYPNPKFLEHLNVNE